MRGALLIGFAVAVATPLGATPHRAASVAEDVAEISTNACFRVASGRFAIPHPASDEYSAAVRQLGLEPGIQRAALGMMGPAIALISRSAMAYRANGSSYIVFAVNGALPGCRVILLGQPPANAMDAIAAALTASAVGWAAIPQMTETRGPATKRVFLRRDPAGRAYLLNLVALNDVPGNVRLYTTIVAVPAGVALPEGF